MKKNFVVIFITFILGITLLSGCSSSKTENTAPNEISGRIMMVGNHPFTHLALQVYPDKAYYLECSKELNDKLVKNQGMYARITYSEIVEKDGGQALKVLTAKIL